MKGLPWWWPALTPAEQEPLISLRDVALLLGYRADLPPSSGLDSPCYSALRVAEIMASMAMDARTNP